jgi:hypothetical protein
MARRRCRKRLEAQHLKTRTHKKNPPKAMLRQKARSKAPRLDPEDRLLKRFYEPLVLLHVLDRNGEQRTPRSLEITDSSEMQLRDLRRTFLDQLAYVCDNIKGGDTVTAIALEAQPSGTVFWVAANNGVSTRTADFLDKVLCTLQSLAMCQTESARSATEAELSQMCIEFGIRRVKAYQALMRKPLQQCLTNLKRSGEQAGE